MQAHASGWQADKVDLWWRENAVNVDFVCMELVLKSVAIEKANCPL